MNNPIKKLDQVSEQTTPKKIYKRQIVEKDAQHHTPSYVIIELQIRVWTVRTLPHAGGNGMVQPCWRTAGQFLTILNMFLPYLLPSPAKNHPKTSQNQVLTRKERNELWNNGGSQTWYNPFGEQFGTVSGLAKLSLPVASSSAFSCVPQTREIFPWIRRPRQGCSRKLVSHIKKLENPTCSFTE